LRFFFKKTQRAGQKGAFPHSTYSANGTFGLF
jgi:hypothetical protein